MAKITPEQLAKSGSESGHQKALFCFLRDQYGIIPDIDRVFAVPNGGKRDKITAGRMRAEGAKRGVPDILWPVWRGQYCGLALELKIQGNTTSDQQNEWITFLRRQGWYAVSVVGWHDAAQVIMSYHALGIRA